MLKLTFGNVWLVGVDVRLEMKRPGDLCRFKLVFDEHVCAWAHELELSRSKNWSLNSKLVLPLAFLIKKTN